MVPNTGILLSHQSTSEDNGKYYRITWCINTLAFCMYVRN